MWCNHQKYSSFVICHIRPNPTRGSTQPMDNSDLTVANIFAAFFLLKNAASWSMMMMMMLAAEAEL